MPATARTREMIMRVVMMVHMVIGMVAIVNFTLKSRQRLIFMMCKQFLLSVVRHASCRPCSARMVFFPVAGLASEGFGRAVVVQC